MAGRRSPNRGQSQLLGVRHFRPDEPTSYDGAELFGAGSAGRVSRLSVLRPSGVRAVDTWDAIRARRDVRAFAERPIADSDLDRILEAGRRSPSSRNSQPWDFVVVTDRERLRQLSLVWRSAGHVASSAVTIALVAAVQTDEHALNTVYFDLGQATVSIMLAAADLGIGSGHSTVADQMLARELLGIPADHFCAHLIPLGYPAEKPLAPLRRPERRPFEEVVHRERW